MPKFITPNLGLKLKARLNFGKSNLHRFYPPQLDIGHPGFGFIIGFVEFRDFTSIGKTLRCNKIWEEINLP